ncbi:MAG: hydroxyacylglutathione hydrolase [Alteromonadaceae bacterium]|nr:MAG: hydroxyacylglutathione hydrolase [Alteromonadaceae bacterium]
MIEVTPLAIFDDNYVWLIQHSEFKGVYVVDPGNGMAVANYLDTHKLSLEGIIITHSHHDHIDGINQLLQSQQAPVYGPDCPRIPQITETVSAGGELKLWQQIPVSIFHTPGHLPEHLSYYVHLGKQHLLFCGDILFSSGCGRIFSGTHVQLKTSLDSFAALPPQTIVYCAHEYTQSNLKFALAVEPEAPALLARQAEVAKLRAANLPSLPTNIEQELQVNPFLRCGHPDVSKKVSQVCGRELHSAQDVFTELRLWKDRF